MTAAPQLPPGHDRNGRESNRGDEPTAVLGARQVLASWLADYPGALVGAVSGNGLPTELPGALDLAGFAQEDRSVLDLVVSEDTRAVTDGFIAALQAGISVTSVHLASAPDEAVLLHYVDLRDELGVLIRVIARSGEESEVGAGPVRHPGGELITSRPRLGFMTKDEVANIVSVDGATTLMLGWTVEEMAGHRSLDFIHPDDHVRAIDNWMARRSNPSARVGTVRLRYLCRDGSWLWLETSNEFVDDGEGLKLVNTQMIDISSEMAANEALRHSEAVLRQVTDTVPVGLFHISGDGGVVFVNPVAQRLFGGVLPGSGRQLCTLLAPGREPEIEEAIDRVMETGIDVYLDLEIQPGEDGVRSSCQVTLRPIADHERSAGVLGCIIDVTELKQIADTDALTGLDTRRSIMHTLTHELRARGGRVAVVYVDLDHFKPVNDRYGHAVGDEILSEAADRLRRGIRPGDRIGRLGGDEFLVICPGVDGPEHGMEIAARVQRELEAPFELDGQELRLAASLGVSCAEVGMTAEQLVAEADAAMYRAKHERSGTRLGAHLRRAG